MLRLFSLSLLSLLVLTGCDAAEDSLLGEFVGTVEVGAEVRRVDGEAIYTVVDGPHGPEFVLGLFVGDLFESDFDEYDYVLFRRPGPRPGVGAYAVDDDPNRAFGATIARVEEADDPLDTIGALLHGVDGTLAFSRIDGYGFVTGSFRFDAEGVMAAPPNRRVAGAASGTFEARYEAPSAFRRLGLDLGV